MNRFFIFFIIAFLAGCNNLSHNNSEQVSEEKVRNEVTQLLENWHKAASEADFDTYFNLMSKDAYFIGTDASENWSKAEFKKFSKPHFDKGKAWDFKAIERNLYLNDQHNMVWFDELLDTWMGTCRGSGVIEYRDQKWKIKHYVLSVTVPNELMDDFIAIVNNK